jgi:hypothetical protein
MIGITRQMASPVVLRKDASVSGGGAGVARTSYTLSHRYTSCSDPHRGIDAIALHPPISTAGPSLQ